MPLTEYALSAALTQAAHGLVGIYRDRREEASSCVTIDLEALDVEEDDGAGPSDGGAAEEDEGEEEDEA